MAVTVTLSWTKAILPVASGWPWKAGRCCWVGLVSGMIFPGLVGFGL